MSYTADQTGKINDRSVLSDLLGVIEPLVRDRPIPSLFEQKRDEFLRSCEHEIGAVAADELVLKNIILKDFRLVHEEGPEITFKYKARLTFQNTTGKRLSIQNAAWDNEAPGSAWKGPEPYLKWQVPVKGGWLNPDEVTVSIGENQYFKTWVAFDESTKDAEIARWVAMKQLGRLEALIKVGDHSVIFERQF